MRFGVVALALFAAGSALAAPAKLAATRPNKAGWLDDPAWPKGDTLSVTWLVYPVPAGEMKSPMQLVLAIGDTSRVVDFPPQLGDDKPDYEPVCAHEQAAYPLGRDEVAKITFKEGSFGGGLVRRAGSNVLEVIAWDQDDGLCGSVAHPKECPRHDKRLARLHVPARVKIEEAIVSIDEHGARQPFGCAR